MANIFGNEMTLEHFQDFYYLEAMRAGISMAKSANPDNNFRHSFERLENDVENTFNEISHNIALRVYVYLYAAALGEARHARVLCKGYIWEIYGMSRNDVFAKSLKYFPNDENVKLLTQTYTQKWNGGGYGGSAWLDIVEGMKLYGKVSDATFIDHAIDLEHNGGSVFTKDGSNVKLNTHKYYASTLKGFLDYKFSHDILNGYAHYSVSRKVYSLLVRYNNIVESIRAIDVVSPRLDNLSHYEVDWEYNTFTWRGDYIEAENDEREYMECNWCDNKIDPKRHQHFNGSCICRECYKNKIYTCDKCQNETLRVHNVEGEYWCDSCTKHYAVVCENCGDYVTEYITASDTENNFCESCAENHTDECKECGIYCEDIDAHNEEEHAENEITFDMPIDSDGIFEAVDKKDEVVYHLASFKFHTGLGILDINDKVYEFPGSGLVVTNNHYNKNDKYKSSYSVTNTTSGYKMGTYNNKNDAIKVMLAIKDVIDWNLITGQESWDKLTEETKQAIVKAKNNATW